MKQAETERDPHRRKSWAEMVVDVVTLSRSIPLMQECVQWARRFLRDPVCLLVYTVTTFCSHQCYDANIIAWIANRALYRIKTL